MSALPGIMTLQSMTTSLMSGIQSFQCMEYEYKTSQKEAQCKRESQNWYYKQDNKLDEILRANDLYDDLHKILHKNGIGLDKLQNEFQENDKQIDALSLNIKQKLKLRKLIRIIGSQQTKPK
eukprot:526964_1